MSHKAQKSALAPIVLFVFNRRQHTEKTIQALQRNSLAIKSDLFIFADGPKNSNQESNVAAVRDLIGRVKGFKNIVIKVSDHNLGLATSVIQGVGQVLQSHGRAIVLEDDIVTTPDFLAYMNSALDFYANHEKVWSISGFGPPIKFPDYYKEAVYLAGRSGSWGWGTWEDRWNQVDWSIKDYPLFSSDKKMQKRFNSGGNDLTDMLHLQMQGKIDSWAIRWCFNQFQRDKYTLFPRVSRTVNIGFDGSGTHCNETFVQVVNLNSIKEVPNFPKDLYLDKIVAGRFRRINNYRLKLLPRVILKRVIKCFSQAGSLLVRPSRLGVLFPRK